MPLVTWYKKYSVKNEELDNQHKKLFDVFNRLYDCCLKAENNDCIYPVIDELIEYTEYHFTAEERYMLENGYKGIEEHKQLHRYFTDKIMKTQQVEDKNDYIYKRELIIFLGNWILKHITVEDKKYANAIEYQKKARLL